MFSPITSLSFTRVVDSQRAQGGLGRASVGRVRGVGDGNVMHGGLAQGRDPQVLHVEPGGLARPDHDASDRVREVAPRQDQSLLGQLVRVLHVRREVQVERGVVQ